MSTRMELGHHASRERDGHHGRTPGRKHALSDKRRLVTASEARCLNRRCGAGTRRQCKPFAQMDCRMCAGPSLCATGRPSHPCALGWSRRTLLCLRLRLRHGRGHFSAVERCALSARTKRSPHTGWTVFRVSLRAAFSRPQGPYASRGPLASALRAFPSAQRKLRGCVVANPSYLTSPEGPKVGFILDKSDVSYIYSILTDGSCSAI